MPKLFCYGTLNVHEIQRSLWGEAKEGEYGRLLDYELKLWPDSFIYYIERKVGEMYDLTDEQLKATDKYEGSAYERITIETKFGSDDFEVYVKAQPKVFVMDEDMKVKEEKQEPVVIDVKTDEAIRKTLGKKKSKSNVKSKNKKK
jgi:gamma-glutamylcyclotransferase (GGCT)/AIG2-like uncharacterized protein YtfP